MYLTRGGQIITTTGSLRYAASLSNYWSSSSHFPDHYAYYLNVNIVNAVLSNHDGRYFGFTVRASLIKTSRNLPMYLTRGGFLYMINGALKYVEVISDYWSASASYVSASAYYFDANTTNFQPARFGDRWMGFTVGKKFVTAFYDRVADLQKHVTSISLIITPVNLWKIARRKIVSPNWQNVCLRR